jgi:hypothetical protein
MLCKPKGLRRRSSMHDRILQLSIQGPVREDDYINAEMFYDNMLNGIADSISDVDDAGEDFEALCATLSGFPGCTYDLDAKTISFNGEYRRNYFGERYEDLRRIVYNLTLDEFCGQTGWDGNITVFDIKRAIENRYDTYIYCDGSLVTLDQFIRYMKQDVLYHFGNTVDYHH